MDNTPIVSPQKIATRIGFKIGSIVEVSDAVTGETRSNPLDKNTYDAHVGGKLRHLVPMLHQGIFGSYFLMSVGDVLIDEVPCLFVFS